MISITVTRAPGDKPGTAISDPLITTERVARAKGTALVNETATNRITTPVTGPALPDQATGQLVELHHNHKKLRSKLTEYGVRYERSGSSFTAKSTLTIEREDDKT